MAQASRERSTNLTVEGLKVGKFRYSKAVSIRRQGSVFAQDLDNIFLVKMINKKILKKYPVSPITL